MSLQLTLGITLKEDATFASYLPGNNAELIERLRQFFQQDNYWCLYLWGEKSVGKTHLLQACCHLAGEQNQRAFYFPLEDGEQFDAQLMDDLDVMDVICLDDIERIAGSTSWQEAVFHLYNKLHVQQKRLIITGNKPPAALPLTLPDLRSRLGADLVFCVHPLSDEDKILALQTHATQRGFDLPETVATFLLNHQSRNMADLFETLNTLDQASLVEQRKLTIPFVKQVLAL